MITFSSGSPCKNSLIVFSIESSSTPVVVVRLPCGSRSITNVLYPLDFNPEAKADAVVVLPQPPFQLATIIFFIICPLYR